MELVTCLKVHLTKQNHYGTMGITKHKDLAFNLFKLLLSFVFMVLLISFMSSVLLVFH